MANEQSGIPLRRWRPFYGAFVAIDEAIEAAGHPRAAFEDVRRGILQLLRAATDDGVAEQLCAALDDAMAEALRTLRVVPVPHSVLASTDLAGAVRALEKHESPRIRSLAGDVVRGWKTANDVARAKVLDKLSGDPIPCRGISTVAVAKGNVRGSVVPATAAEVHKMKLHTPPVKMLPTATEVKKKPVVSQSKKLEAKKPIVAQHENTDAKKPIFTQSQKKMEANKQPVITQSEKMETTKRKLHEDYEEAKRLKLEHKIQKVNDKEAPKLLEQSQWKMHRIPGRCRTSSGVRRSLLPSLQLI